jgi:hypothetical protein
MTCRQSLFNLIEVVLGSGRRAVPPPQWPDVPRLAGERDERKPQEAAPTAEPLREERSDAPAVSRRKRVADS